ncbi:MAG: pitrilysin family protein [Cyanobacteriota bacterium]
MATEKTYKLPFLQDEAHIYHLDNDHTVITIKKPGEITNVSTWVKTGSINENDNNNGVSHFLEHLMFKGTERFKPGEFDKTLESRGGIINAATWKDYTFYYVTIPQGENYENFNLAIDLHSDMILNSIIPDEEIGPTYDLNDSEVKEKRERSVVIEEISMREDQPWTKTYNTLNSMMYQQHPYKRDTIGTKEIIASISRDEILDYYKKWYVPENMITVIVSDKDHKEVLELVKNYFQFQETNQSPESVYETEPPPKKIKETTIYGEIKSGFGIIGFHGPKPCDLSETIAIEVVSIVLGEGRSSRLQNNLIEKPEVPLFTMIYCTQYQFRDGNNILIQFNFTPEEKETAIEQIINELKNLKENPVTEDELKKAKKKLESRFAEAAETASGLAESIGYSMILTNDIETYTHYLEELKKVTIENISRTVAKYMNIDNACITTMTPQK